METGASVNFWEIVLVIFVIIVIYLLGYLSGKGIKNIKKQMIELEKEILGLIFGLKNMMKDTGFNPEEKHIEEKHIQNYYAYEIKNNEIENNKLQKQRKWRIAIIILMSAMFLALILTMTLVIIMYTKYGA